MTWLHAGNSSGACGWLRPSRCFSKGNCFILDCFSAAEVGDVSSILGHCCEHSVSSGVAGRMKHQDVLDVAILDYEKIEHDEVLRSQPRVCRMPWGGELRLILENGRHAPIANMCVWWHGKVFIRKFVN